MRLLPLLLLLPALALVACAPVDAAPRPEEDEATAGEGHGDGEEHAEEDHGSHDPIDHVLDHSLDTVLVKERTTATSPMPDGGRLFTDGDVRFIENRIPVGAVLHITAAKYGLQVGGKDIPLPHDVAIAKVVSETEVELAESYSVDPGVITYSIKKKHFLSSIGVTKHVLMLWLAGGLCCVMGFSVGRQAKNIVPKGLRNLIEAILLFLRDEVAKPQLGHNTDKYLPFIWTFFFFILFCNLLGLVPFMATATGNINVTATLAVIAFVFYQTAGILEQGFVPYLKNIVPSGIPLWLYPLMLLVEIIGHFAKPFALAVRLFANMIAGHIVMAVILGFATVSLAIAPIAVAGGVFMYMLETFVGFLQAFIFTFLMTVFLGMAVHPDH